MITIAPRVDPRCRENLTPREQHVLRLVACGYSNQGIARAIHISENTVKFHLKNVYSKIGANHRGHAVAIATSVGLFAPVQSPLAA